MTKNDEFLEEILKKKKKNPQDEDDDEEGDFGESSTEEESGDKKDEDDDQNFIKKDDNTKDVRKELVENLNEELQGAKKRLEGVLPESNQQRNLDRETGGVEAKEEKETTTEDVWDKRAEQIDQMNEDEQDLNNSSKSSRDQSFIHRKKQEKKHQKAHIEAAKNSFENMGYVKRLQNMRQDRSGIDGKDNQGGGRGM